MDSDDSDYMSSKTCIRGLGLLRPPMWAQSSCQTHLNSIGALNTHMLSFLLDFLLIFIPGIMSDKNRP